MEYICPYCNKKLNSGKSLGGHKTKCLLNPNRITNKGKHIKWKNHKYAVYSDVVSNCRYCNKQCKNLNSLHQHEIRCKNNPDRIQQSPKFSYKGKVGWSKGLTKDTDKRVGNISIGVNEYYDTHDGTFKGKHLTDQTKKLLSEIAIDQNYQSHWGTRHSYEYKGETFISSYEVITLRSLDDNGVRWVKPKYGTFKYIDLNGKKHSYTPDIYLPDYDVYLDPKNDFLIENENPALGYKDCDKIKWVCEQNGVKIIVLSKNQLSWEAIKTLI